MVVRFEKVTFIEKTKVIIQVKRTIIPPVNNKITAYIIHAEILKFIKNPILTVRKTNQTISNAGLVVINADKTPALINIKNLNIKIN